MKPICPTCQRTLPKPKVIAAVSHEADMSEADLFTYYKRIAPQADLEFLFHRASDTLRAEIRAALAHPNARTVRRLYDLWRVERFTADRAAGIPQVGSPAWFAEQGRVIPEHDPDWTSRVMVEGGSDAEV